MAAASIAAISAATSPAVKVFLCCASRCSSKFITTLGTCAERSVGGITRAIEGACGHSIAFLHHGEGAAFPYPGIIHRLDHAIVYGACDLLMAQKSVAKVGVLGG